MIYYGVRNLKTLRLIEWGTPGIPELYRDEESAAKVSGLGHEVVRLRLEVLDEDAI